MVAGCAMGEPAMTTEYHDLSIATEHVTRLMRRINALEKVGESINTGVQVLAPDGVDDLDNWEGGTQSPTDWRLGEDGNVYSLHGLIEDGGIAVSYYYVRKYSIDGTFIAQFGNYYPDEADPVDRRFAGDLGITADADGNFYLRGNKLAGRIGLIRRFDSSGVLVNEWEIGSAFTTTDAQDIQVRGSYIFALTTGDNRGDRLGITDPADTWYTKVIRWDLDGSNRTEILSTERDSSHPGTLPTYKRSLSVHENYYFWIVPAPDLGGSSISLYDADGELVSSEAISPWGNSFHNRATIGLDNTYWKLAIGGYRQYTHLGDATGRVVLSVHTHPFEDQFGVVNWHLGAGTSPGRARWFKAFGIQTTFYKYKPEPESLGTPDGGIAVPALNAFSITYHIMAAQIIEDMRNAIEALAPFYENEITEEPFNWTNSDEDNLYSIAVDTTDYGDTGTQYDWHRTKAQMYDKFPVSRDIGEIEDCVTLLEASDLVT
jgi:hypothetical protein